VVNANDTVPLYDEEFRLVKVDGVAQTAYGKPVYFKNLQPELMPEGG
jgi:hypothetical protein